MSMNDNLEAFAAEHGWIVKYAADGTPSFFKPVYKCNSSDLDPSLPNHTHPAFIINGQEVDRRLIAVFKGSELNGAIHSLPNMPPKVNAGADALLASIKAAGPGFGPKTVADSGLLLLLARKQGITVVKGNNSYGADYRDGTKWDKNQSVTVGAIRIFQGVAYTCLQNHTTSWALRPDVASAYWKKGKRVGGVPVQSQINESNPNGLNTMTGSGPASWRFGGDPDSWDDLTGNCNEQDYGYRIVGNELQILENNNAASPDADLSASSLAWKAILPNQDDNGHTLVAPGTAGTLKWNWLNNKITLDTETDLTINADKNTAFSNLAVNTEHVPFVPAILQELGLFPISGDTTQGTVYVHFSNTTTDERFPRRGGGYDSTSSAGLAFVHSHGARGHSGPYYGARSGFVESD